MHICVKEKELSLQKTCANFGWFGYFNVLL